MYMCVGGGVGQRGCWLFMDKQMLNLEDPGYAHHELRWEVRESRYRFGSRKNGQVAQDFAKERNSREHIFSSSGRLKIFSYLKGANVLQDVEGSRGLSWGPCWQPSLPKVLSGQLSLPECPLKLSDQMSTKEIIINTWFAGMKRNLHIVYTTCLVHN